MKTLLAVVLLICVAVVMPGQEIADEELRRGFGSLRLGISMQEAKDTLGTDPNFNYRGEPDVSLIPSSGIPVIETEGVAFIDRAILQFSDDRLYILTLVLNRRRLDYFGVFSEFSSRYGRPDSLDPDRAIWESDSVRITVERPLTVKYIDINLFNETVEAGVLEESLEEMTRERFLEEL